jgi:glycosyltransferase involved in cell wall biosynthesis
LRILHIIATLGGGGTEKALVSFLKNCSPKIDNYVCCITTGGIYERDLKKIGIKYFILNRRFRFDFSIIKQIRRLIEDFNIDIIQTYNFTGNLWGRLAAKKNKSIKTITFERGTIWYNNFIMNVLEKWLEKYTDQYLANSNAAKMLLNFKTGVPLEKITVINNGIESIPIIDKNKKKMIEKELNIENASYILGFVGRIVSIKGIDIIIRAMEIVLKVFPNAVLLFVGSGNQLKYYKNMVKEKKLSKNIIFTGFRTNTGEIIQIFDILVQPSVSESFPNTILEAMFAKVTVLASNVDGISEIIEDNKTGILIEPEIQIRGPEYPKYHFNGKLKKITKTRAISPEKLSKKIIQMLKNENLRENLVRNAYKIAIQKYNIERYVKELEVIYFTT